jgi:hypothetical protein
VSLATASYAAEINPAAMVYKTPDQFTLRDPTDKVAVNQGSTSTSARSSLPASASPLPSERSLRDQQTPEALRALQKAEIGKWWPIIKEAGIKAPKEVRRRRLTGGPPSWNGPPAARAGLTEQRTQKKQTRTGRTEPLCRRDAL